MSQIPIAYVDVRFLTHGTEDVNKVVKAVQSVLPENGMVDLVFNKRRLKGHYGNPIMLFEAKIKNKKTIRALVENLSSHLSASDKEMLRKKVHLHVENGSLYMRLDKQAALQGQLKLCTIDPIRLHIRFRKRRIEDMVETCRELGILP